MKQEHSFDYNFLEKKFIFSNEGDYRWAKAVIGNLHLSLYINHHPMKPFQVFFSDTKHFLILRGLDSRDEREILDLLELNGLMKTPYKDRIQDSEVTPLMLNQEGHPNDSQKTESFTSWKSLFIPWYRTAGIRNPDSRIIEGTRRQALKG